MLFGLLLAGKYQENCLPGYILSAKYWTDSTIEYEIDANYAKGNNVDANNEDVNGDYYGPSTEEMYTHAVIFNTARKAQTELNMEGFVMRIIWKVSSNQKQAN